MANFSFLNAQDYANDVSGLFTLKEDGDTARVRILIDTPDDLRGVWTHWLQVNGRGRHVLCLADGECKDEKIYRQQCPICRFGKTSKEGKRHVKFFIPMLNLDTNEYVIWERGYNLVKNQSLLNILSEYPKELYKQVVEIQRIGDANDYNTEYTFKVLPESEVSYTRVDGNLSEFDIPIVSLYDPYFRVRHLFHYHGVVCYSPLVFLAGKHTVVGLPHQFIFECLRRLDHPQVPPVRSLLAESIFICQLDRILYWHPYYAGAVLLRSRDRCVDDPLIQEGPCPVVDQHRKSRIRDHFISI